MPSNQLYVVSFVQVGGKLLTEEAECTMQRSSNASPVRTMAKGLAGVSPGAPECEIDVMNAVPAADFEYDPGEAILENDVVEIGVLGPGGKTAVSSGFILSDTFGQGVGKEGTLSFKFIGTFPKWQ